MMQEETKDRLIKLVAELNSQLLDDDLEIAWNVQVAQLMFPGLDEQSIADLVIAAVVEIVRQGKGSMNDVDTIHSKGQNHWVRWPGDADDIKQELNARWKRLRRMPKSPLGELGWLLTTANFKDYSAVITDTNTGKSRSVKFKAIDFQDAVRRLKKGRPLNEIAGDPKEC